MNTRKSKLLKQTSLKLLIVVCLFLLALFVFAFIAQEAVLEQEDTFDKTVSTFFTQHATGGWIKIMRDFTFFGSSYFLFPAYAILVGYFVIRKRYTYAMNISIIVISSFLIMQGLKQLFHRQRPEFPIIKGITSYSFPSGHTLSSFIFCSILAYLVLQGTLSKIWKLLLSAALLFFAITIGMSRIVLNVHYTTDVIAGFCLGVMWVILSFGIFKKMNMDT